MNKTENKLVKDISEALEKEQESTEDKPKRKYNTQNLISLADRPLEERQAIGRLGGLAAARTNAERKPMKERLDYLLKKGIRAQQRNQLAEFMKMTDEELEELNQQDVILVAMMLEAQNGNVKAAQYVRDTVGEAPTIKQEVTADVMTDGDRMLLAKVMERVGMSTTGGQKSV